MFADDTIIYCIRDTADGAITKLNTALRELRSWCLTTSKAKARRCSFVVEILRSLLRKLSLGSPPLSGSTKHAC